MSKFAVVGAGFIGRAWAISFARAGHEVALWDQDAAAPSAALDYIDSLLPELATLDLLNGNSVAQVRSRMRGVASLEDALADAGYVLEEAFRLVAGGHASVEDVDIGIREGLALRWSFMGPFETIDLNAPGGVRDYVERYESIYQRLQPSMRERADWGGPVLKEIEAERRKRLPATQLQARQAWRDRRLMALAAHKRRAAQEIKQ